MPTITSAELAKSLGADLLGPGDVPISQIASLDLAAPGSVTFIRNHRFARRWSDSRASAAIITRDIALGDVVPNFDPSTPASPRPLIIVPDADLALIKCLPIFETPREAPAPGVHASSVIHPTATVDPTAAVGPLCVVGAGAKIGARAVLASHVALGAEASIGSDTVLHPHVSVLDRCEVGRHCILHAGVVVGADGFGYHPAPGGQGLIKIPHIGNVVIDDHVEIGANSCIDRAKFGSTTIGAGTKIDNLVQIAHGCRVGRSCVICGGAALAGSAVLGDGVVLGGGAGVADGAEVGAGSKVGAFSGVSGSVPPGSVYLGQPAVPATEWRRFYATMRRMGRRGIAPE